MVLAGRRNPGFVRPPLLRGIDISADDLKGFLKQFHNYTKHSWIANSDGVVRPVARISQLVSTEAIELLSEDFIEGKAMEGALREALEMFVSEADHLGQFGAFEGPERIEIHSPVHDREADMRGALTETVDRNIQEDSVESKDVNME